MTTEKKNNKVFVVALEVGLHAGLNEVAQDFLGECKYQTFDNVDCQTVILSSKQLSAKEINRINEETKCFTIEDKNFYDPERGLTYIVHCTGC